MSKERVQILIRVMPDEKEMIQELAKKADKSMNQYIVDCVLNDSTFEEMGSMDDDLDEEGDITTIPREDESEKDNSLTNSAIFNLLKNQLQTKDKQINRLQILLDQQQKLSLSDKKENERLRLNIEELESELTIPLTEAEDEEDEIEEEQDDEKLQEDRNQDEEEQVSQNVDSSEEEQEEKQEESSNWWQFWKR